MEEEIKAQPTSDLQKKVESDFGGFLMPTKINKSSAKKEKQEIPKIENKWTIIDIDLTTTKPPIQFEGFR